MYNVTNLTSANTYYGYLYALNNLSGGVISLFFITVIWFIFMIAFKNYDTKIAIIASSTITTTIAVLMWAAKMFPAYLLAVPFSILGLGIIAKLLGGSDQ